MCLAALEGALVMSVSQFSCFQALPTNQRHTMAAVNSSYLCQLRERAQQNMQGLIKTFFYGCLSFSNLCPATALKAERRRHVATVVYKWEVGSDVFHFTIKLLLVLYLKNINR